jgi:hypothetical protein
LTASAAGGSIAVNMARGNDSKLMAAAKDGLLRLAESGPVGLTGKAIFGDQWRTLSASHSGRRRPWPARLLLHLQATGAVVRRGPEHGEHLPPSTMIWVPARPDLVTDLAADTRALATLLWPPPDPFGLARDAAVSAGAANDANDAAIDEDGADADEADADDADDADDVAAAPAGTSPPPPLPTGLGDGSDLSEATVRLLMAILQNMAYLRGRVDQLTAKVDRLLKVWQ